MRSSCIKPSGCHQSVGKYRPSSAYFLSIPWLQSEPLTSGPASSHTQPSSPCLQSPISGPRLGPPSDPGHRAEAMKAKRRRKHALTSYKNQQMVGDPEERRAAPFNEGHKGMPHQNGTQENMPYTNGVAPNGTHGNGAWGNGHHGGPMVHDNTAYDHNHGDVENGVGHNRDIATWSTVGANKGPNPVITERV